MAANKNKKPGSVGKRYPGQQQNFARSIAQRNHSKPNTFANSYTIAFDSQGGL